MKCKQSRALFEALMKGILSSESSAGLRRHLTACKKCDAEYRYFYLGRQILRKDAEEIEPSPFFYARLRARIAAQESEREQESLLPFWDAVRQFAPVTLIIIAFMLTLTIVSLRGQPPITAVEGLLDARYAMSEEGLIFSDELDRDHVLETVLSRGRNGNE